MGNDESPEEQLVVLRENWRMLRECVSVWNLVVCSCWMSLVRGSIMKSESFIVPRLNQVWLLDGH